MYLYICIIAQYLKLIKMAKIQVSWQLPQKTLEKIKSLAKKRNVAIQVIADELLTKGLENGKT